jgi:tetratricopeptide (TPR) repeat protein
MNKRYYSYNLYGGYSEDPTDFDTFKERGRLYFSKNKPDSTKLAITMYTKAITVAGNPNDKSIVLSNRAKCYSRLKNYDAKLKDIFQISTLLITDGPITQSRIVELLSKDSGGKIDNPFFQAFSNGMLYYYKLKQYIKAITSFLDALAHAEIDPQRAAAHRMLSMSYIKNDSPHDGLKHALEIKTLDQNEYLRLYYVSDRQLDWLIIKNTSMLKSNYCTGYVDSDSCPCRNESHKDYNAAFLIQGHGQLYEERAFRDTPQVSLNPFCIYKGTSIIFLTDPGINLNIDSDIDNLINEAYTVGQIKEGGIMHFGLFYNNDTTHELNDYGIELENYMKGQGYNTNIHNHIGTSRGTLVNDVLIYFNEAPCPSSDIREGTTCGISCFWYPKKQPSGKYKYLTGSKYYSLNNKRAVQEFNYTVKLSEIIQKYGKGTYIIRTCRAIDRPIMHKNISEVYHYEGLDIGAGAAAGE